MRVCTDLIGRPKSRVMIGPALKIFGDRAMLMMIVEMVVLSAVVVGLLHKALHPEPTDDD